MYFLVEVVSLPTSIKMQRQSCRIVLAFYPWPSQARTQERDLEVHSWTREVKEMLSDTLFCSRLGSNYHMDMTVGPANPMPAKFESKGDWY